MQIQLRWLVEGEIVAILIVQVVGFVTITPGDAIVLKEHGVFLVLALVKIEIKLLILVQIMLNCY